jgi:CheY-like chemotaxis protein
LPHVFERFWQADRKDTRSHEGFGIGLSIVAHLVREHGGHIEVQSEGVDRGALFTMTFPRHFTEAESSHQENGKRQSRSSDQIDVLIVDDDVDAAQALGLVLRGRGFPIRIATSVDEAVTCIEERRPTVLVSDIMMPVRSGIDLIRQIRGQEQESDLPRIAALAISGRGGRDYQRKVQGEGFDSYLPKPVDTDRLCETLLDLVH